MSFTGDLEYLPIVDIIQLLHATKRSGILRVKSRKGASGLVFKDGCIVSANHLNNSVRIGKILIDRDLITAEILDQALLEQKNAGSARKPLIISLINKGLVKDEDAYQGLEQLIEMTIVEMLTWKRGTFTMEVPPAAVVDEYRYYPGKINREVAVDAQGVLMDALCIFDERMRSGELSPEEIPADDGNAAAAEERVLSAHDPGLLCPGGERLVREERGTCHHRAAGETLPLEEEPVALERALPPELGWVAVLAGVVVLALGVKGCIHYGDIPPPEDAFPGIEAPGPFRLYLSHGLLPTLQALLGMWTTMAGAQVLKARSGARKMLHAAVWGGIACVIASGLFELIVSTSMASSSPSFWYHPVNIIWFLLMTTLWCAPLWAVAWFLRKDLEPALARRAKCRYG